MADTQHSQPAGKASAGARLAAKRAAKAARKAAKREPDPILSENELAAGVAQASGFLQRHQWAVWGGFAVLVLFGTVVGTLALNSHKTADEATAALATGVRTGVAPIIPETEVVTEDDRTQETFPSLTARAKQALVEHRSTVQTFPGTAAARWAKLGVANAELDLNHYRKAEVAYRKALAAGDHGAFLRFRILEGLGFSLEGQEKYAAAAQAFEDAAKVEEGVYAPEAGLHVARMLEAQGRRDAAVERLKEVLAATAERAGEAGPSYSALNAEVEQRLAELGAPQPARKPAGLTPELLEQLKGQLGDDAERLDNQGQDSE